MRFGAYAGLMIGMLPALAFASDATGMSANSDGVRQAENAWGKAFITGDVSYLDGLLNTDYVSVDTHGRPHPKAEIIKMAQDFAEAHPNTLVSPMPASSSISLKGDTAVVVHHGEKEISVDVFNFDNGRWHAWYSQHTSVNPV